MNKYCAFLRGVNVNGRKMLMHDVCGVFGEAGMSEVSSVLATGNIIFKSGKQQSELKTLLENALTAHFSNPVYLFVKSASEISDMLENCPYMPYVDLHTYLFICEIGFENEFLAEFKKINPAEREEASVVGGYFYWRVPKGSTLDAGFSKALGRKAWQNLFTSRNINTIEKVRAKLNIKEPVI